MIRVKLMLANTSSDKFKPAYILIPQHWNLNLCFLRSFSNVYIEPSQFNEEQLIAKGKRLRPFLA